MIIKVLRAFHGDCILFSFTDKENQNRNILVDGGTRETYEYNEPRNRKSVPGDLKIIVEDIRQKKESIDLLILTHVDSDHIGGILKWFDNDPNASDLIGKIWFNSGRLISEYFGQQEIKENLLPLVIKGDTDTGIKQGGFVEDYIEKHDIWDRRIIKDGQRICEFGLEFRILSPSAKNLEKLLQKWEKESPQTLTARAENDYKKSLVTLIETDQFKEDNSIHNASSIAFILTFDGKNVLMLGDAHPSTVIDGLKCFGFSPENRLKAELVKVSHHGSKANTCYELLSYIDTKSFVVSTNGKSHNLPDKQCLARLINNTPDANLYFNYPEIISQIFSAQDQENFDFLVASGDRAFII